MLARRALLALVFALIALAWFFYVRGFERPAVAVGEPQPATLQPRAPPASAALVAPAPLAQWPPAERVELEPPALASVGTAFEELDEQHGLLQVRVLALETGQPLSGARVRLETPAGESLATSASRRARGGVHESLLSDAQGRADFRVPAATPFVLHAQFDAPLGSSARLDVRALEGGACRTLVVEVFGAADRSWCARVVDGESGAGLPGARVKLGDGRRPRASLFDAPTEADGSLRLALSSRVEYRVRVEAAGYAPRTVVVEAGHATQAEAQVIRCLRQAALEVRVSDAEQRPLAEFELALTLDPAWRENEQPDGIRLSGPAALEARTDAHGRARFEALPARVAFTLCGKVRTRPVRVLRLDGGLAPGELHTLDWALGTGCVLTGTVLDQAGEPVANLPLWLAPAGAQAGFFEPRLSPESLLTTESDEHGLFRFEDVAAGAWRVGPQPRLQWYVVESGGALSFFEGAEEPALEPARRAAPAPLALALLEGESERNLVLNVWCGLYLRGRVQSADGQPLPGELVLGRSGEFVAEARAREDGRFELGPLMPGTYALDTPRVGARCRPQNAPAGAEGVVLVLED